MVAISKRNRYSPKTGFDYVGDVLKLLSEVIGKE